VNIFIRITGLKWWIYRQNPWDLYALIIIPTTLILGSLSIAQDHYRYTFFYHLSLDAVTLLLLPRVRCLSNALKTAKASILPLSNVLSLWLVCYLVFAIAFTETLGTISLSLYDNWTANFLSIPNTFNTLFQLAMGDEWPDWMDAISNAVVQNCRTGKGQCRNPAEVRALFTVWNILSMYFFANVCTAVVFVYASTNIESPSSLSPISREELRRYKEAWAVFDPQGTGYVPREKIARLLGVSIPKVSSAARYISQLICFLGTVRCICNADLRGRLYCAPHP
jgi:hypothetical protein